jgi:hypothetical protein
VTTESPRWVTSSYSGNGGQCIQVATNLAASRGVVPVRDSKNPIGPTLLFSASEWDHFVSFAKSADV